MKETVRKPIILGAISLLILGTVGVAATQNNARKVIPAGVITNNPTPQAQAAETMPTVEPVVEPVTEPAVEPIVETNIPAEPVVNTEQPTPPVPAQTPDNPTTEQPAAPPLTSANCRIAMGEPGEAVTIPKHCQQQ